MLTCVFVSEAVLCFFQISVSMDIIKTSFLLPALKLDDQKFEFIFLLDNSGSMSGAPIELAKQSLNLILHSLPASCYFNIITFNSSYHPLFPQSVPYNGENLQRAKGLVAGIFGDGGTELYTPLTYIYNQPQIPGYLTQIFSITDGCVMAPDRVIQLVASKMSHSRSFSLGIGNSVDRNLVMEIAKNAGGSYEFVTYGEKIESKILNQLKIAQKPALLKPIRLGPTQLILDGSY